MSVTFQSRIQMIIFEFFYGNLQLQFWFQIGHYYQHEYITLKAVYLSLNSFNKIKRETKMKIKKRVMTSVKSF